MRNAIPAFVLLAATAAAQPVISTDGIRNSASYANRGMLTSGIAQGSLFIIFGRNLGPAALVQSSLPLATELAGVSVRINSGGREQPALMFYASAGQIGAILPSNAATGDATLTVRYNGLASDVTPFYIGRVKPGLYTRSQTGGGPAVAQNFITEDNQPFNSLLTPARPGQVVTLWATGLGPVAGDEAAGPQPGDLATNLRYLIGGKEARILYQGRSGCCAGVDQIVLEIPAGIEGCYVPVVAASPTRSGHSRIPEEGPASNYATLAIAADGSACHDALGLSGDELTRLQDGARVASLTFVRKPDFDASRKTTDRFTGRFARYTAAELLARNDIYGLPPAGTCIASALPAAAAPSVALDAGALTLRGPAGALTVNRGASGDYQQDLGNTFLAPGIVGISAAGGADVGAFEVEGRVPTPINWTNRSEARVSSIPPLRWSGGDPGNFVVLTNESYSRYTGLGILCVESAAAGVIALPTDTSLVQIGYDGPFGSAPDITSLSTVAPATRFRAPGIDLGLILFSVAADSFYRQ